MARISIVMTVYCVPTSIALVLVVSDVFQLEQLKTSVDVEGHAAMSLYLIYYPVSVLYILIN